MQHYLILKSFLLLFRDLLILRLSKYYQCMIKIGPITRFVWSLIIFDTDKMDIQIGLCSDILGFYGKFLDLRIRRFNKCDALKR